jgi:hypothetical protein
MGGLDPAGASERKSWPIARAHVTVSFLLGRLSERARPVLAQWQEDSKSAFLMVSTLGHLLVLGVDPFGWGDVFGEVVDFLLWVGGGGEEELQGSYCTDDETMFRRTMRVPNSPVCMLYIICWTVEVSLQHVFRPLRRGSLILDCPGQTRALLGLQQPVDIVTH